MDHIMQRHKDQLILRTDIFDDSAARSAYSALMRNVFALDTAGADTDHNFVWHPFAFFDREGFCVASVEAAVMTMMVDSVLVPVTGIRLAGVDPSWRGLGLFRDIMVAALAWCESATTGPTLLYTADHALYDRFGFQPVGQFKVIGRAPPPLPRQASRTIDPHGVADGALLRRLLAVRAPVSQRCSLVGAAPLVLSNILAAEDLVLGYVPSLEAIVVYEQDESAILIVDIIAEAIPTMAQILSALPQCAQVTTLFPPDQLDWTGDLVREDTGLMIKGPAPAALGRPFMLPPTTEF